MIHLQNFVNYVVVCLLMIVLASMLCLSIWFSWFKKKILFHQRSSFEWNTSPYDVPDLYAKPGTPCDNYNGYCDVNQRCREVDPSSPLATLRRLLLSNESMASLKRWFNEQWFYVAVLILITVLILVNNDDNGFLFLLRILLIFYCSHCSLWHIKYSILEDHYD